MMNCYSFTEGVEVPVLGAVLLLRPTQQGVAAGARRRTRIDFGLCRQCLAART